MLPFEKNREPRLHKISVKFQTMYRSCTVLFSLSRYEMLDQFLYVTSSLDRSHVFARNWRDKYC